LVRKANMGIFIRKSKMASDLPRCDGNKAAPLR
jgi:hypothetical protein